MGITVGAHAIHLLLASSLLIIALSTVEVVQKLGSLAYLEAASFLAGVSLSTWCATPIYSIITFSLLAALELCIGEK